MTSQQFDKMITHRELSSFGVSVGTGLMLESVFDPTDTRIDDERVIPPKVNLLNYKGWLLNAFTLIRNIITSVTEDIPYDKITDSMVSRLMEEVEAEIAVIQSLLLVKNVDEHFIKLFIPKYYNLSRIFNVGKETDVKYIENNLKVIELFRKPLMSLGNYITKVVPENYKLDREYNDKYLLTSHYTIDLLQSTKWELLESHTGVLKDHHMFYTKLHPFGSKDLSHIPMVDIVLYILGDNQLVRGFTPKIKQELYNISLDKKWTYRTTREKVKFDLRNNKILEPLIKQFKGY